METAESKGEHILIVDDEEALRKVVTKILQPEGYHCSEARNGEDALARLDTDQFSLILTDIRMPGMGGLELFAEIRARRDDLAVVIMTANGDLQDAVKTLRDGAYDYVVKPFDAVQLRHVVARALERRRLYEQNVNYQKGLEKLVEERTSQLVETYRQTLWALASAVEARDLETREHTRRVIKYSTALAPRLGINGAKLRDLEWGAILHDIGKIGVPDAVLLKPGPLTEEEFEVVKRHPEIGHRILEGIPFLKGAIPVVRYHHERWDGTGYPLGLRGEEIPLEARVFAVVDAFDAITSERPYKGPRSPQYAREEIVRSSGSHFDPAVVDVFLTVFDGEPNVFQLPASA